MHNPARQQFAAQPTTEVELAVRTLVIGNVGRWIAEGRTLVSLDHVHFTDLDGLTSELLSEIDPDLILSPLFGGNFDVIDVAQRLTELGYEGRYRAISENMPDSEMIRREVCAQSEGLDFDLLSLPPKRCEQS
ncbi:MAG: hypothetical protein ACSHXW_02890 [Yoonia sp.]